MSNNEEHIEYLLSKIEFFDLALNSIRVDAVELKELINNDIDTWIKLIEKKEVLHNAKESYEEYHYGKKFDVLERANIAGSYHSFDLDLYSIINGPSFDNEQMKELTETIQEQLSLVIFTDSAVFDGLSNLILHEKYHPNAARDYIVGVIRYSELLKIRRGSPSIEYVNSGFVHTVLDKLKAQDEFLSDSLAATTVKARESFKEIERARNIAEKNYEYQLKKYQENIQHLELAHGEMLRLKEPASYWGKSAKKYKQAGEIWIGILAVSVVIGFLALSKLFIYWLGSEKSELSLVTAQAAIFIMLGSAAFFYFLRVCSRLIFSSFHLMRDAEEREQLTYVYLSLVKDKSIESDERTIILQSLFSRTDTGLLSGDSSPTMPTADILKLLKSDKGSG